MVCMKMVVQKGMSGSQISTCIYLPAMPHALGSSGAQVGIGRALVLAMVALTVVVAFELEADEIWVEAAAPVTARTTMKARTMFFMR